VIRLIKSVTRRWRSKQRAKQRAIDVAILFPEFWDRSQGNPVRFLTAVAWHCATDPAWRIPQEWKGTDHDPASWALARFRAERDAQKGKS